MPLALHCHCELRQTPERRIDAGLRSPLKMTDDSTYCCNSSRPAETRRIYISTSGSHPNLSPVHIFAYVCVYMRIHNVYYTRQLFVAFPHFECE